MPLPSDAAGDKTFVLGVGCQKGGTSWLHHFLRRLPAAEMGFLKEYHVWDALSLPECGLFRQLAFGWPPATKTGISWPLLDNEQQAQSLRSFYEDVANYFNYFESIFADSRLSGDLTPSYGMLPAAVYRRIREDFASLGITVKVIFLLRDPVERICSHVRKSRNHAVTPNEDLLARHHRPDVRARTTYEVTLRNLEEAFPADLVHCEFYERLFTEPAIGRLCEFLGVSSTAADFTTHVNTSDRSIVFDEQVKQRVATFYGQTYREIAARFGRADVLELWPRGRMIVEAEGLPNASPVPGGYKSAA